MTLSDSTLWQDACGMPDALSDSLARADGHEALAAAIGASDVRRLVLSGNGASWYAASAAALAALSGAHGLDIACVPAGMLAAGDAFAWRPGDYLVAVSSSGSLRDLLETLEQPGAPTPFGLITADPSSPLGERADVCALVTVNEQRAITHTQAYAGSVAVLLDVIARASGDEALRHAVRTLPDLLATQLDHAAEWAAGAREALIDQSPRAAMAFGTGPSWVAALEAALLLKEVAAIPAEGTETREGATTGMYALDDEQLVLSFEREEDRLAAEAASVCAGRGAQVLRIPWTPGTDARVAAAAQFLHPLALTIEMALAQQLDPDQPTWYAAYESTARRSDTAQERP